VTPLSTESTWPVVIADSSESTRMLSGSKSRARPRVRPMTADSAPTAIRRYRASPPVVIKMGAGTHGNSSSYCQRGLLARKIHEEQAGADQAVEIV
jgi:hypothetical protein